MIIYLYKKTHQVTGLKYLGKTTKDPYTYLGSGLEWKSHLKEFGKSFIVIIDGINCDNTSKLFIDKIIAVFKLIT